MYCGHTEIIYWQAAEKQYRLLDGLSPPLGMLVEQYQTSVVSYDPGDCFVFYFDGITEAENESGEQYGINRLCKLIGETHRDPAEEMIHKIRQEVACFSSSIQSADDISCIVVKA